MPQVINMVRRTTDIIEMGLCDFRWRKINEFHSYEFPAANQ